MAMDEKGLGHRLQLARKAAGLTQQSLCQIANLSYSTLAKIERGAIKAPSIFTIQSIADALNIRLDELIGRSMPSAPPVKKRYHSKGGISFVYFDINGCLVRFFHRAFTKLADASGQLADVVETAFWHYNDQVCRGEISVDEFNNALAKRLGMPSVDWQTYYLEAIQTIPESQKLVSWVSQYYGVGILTNIMPGFLDTMCQKKLIPDVAYDAIIDSSAVHTIKPEPEMYKIAVKKAGCRPDEILLVDDSMTNLVAAEKAGWHVLWFDDFRPDESTKRIRQTLELVTAEAVVPQAGLVD
jgi:FMN phosphatase YigB (HAD superfamily)/DNA-binding XRE family transcriptional regulator